jgi:hypothetical protein
MTAIMIFDALDTVQGYKGAPLGESKYFLQKHLAQEAGISQWNFVHSVPYERQLELTAEAIQRGDLEPVMLPGTDDAFNFVKELGIRPVIVTADIPEAAVLTTKPIVDEGYVAANDVYAIAKLGSKRELTTWEKAREAHFPDTYVLGVFEDSDSNLVAAMRAYDSLGFLVMQESTHPTSTCFISHLPARIASGKDLKEVTRGNLPSIVVKLDAILDRLLDK